MTNHQKDAWCPTTPPKYGGLPPSSSSGNSCYSPLPWEIEFCSQIPWKKFCECKRISFLFENVLNWDDSAGKEAFDTAKTRYLKEMNGVRCDIPFPDPDMYIDVVNQDTFLDPKLVEDLYKLPPATLPHEELVPDYDSIKIIPTGWDVEDPGKARDTIPTFIFAGDDQYVRTAERSCCGCAAFPILEVDPADISGAVVPTGWDEEEDLCSGDALNPSEQQTIDAFYVDKPGIKKRVQIGQNVQFMEQDPIDEPVTITPTGWGEEEDLGSINVCTPSEQRTNDAFCVDSWEMDHKDGNFVSSSHKKDRSWRNERDFGRRLSSNHTSVRHQGGNFRANGRRLNYSNVFNPPSGRQTNDTFCVDLWEMDHKDGNFVKSSCKKDSWQNERDFGRRLSSNHTNVRYQDKFRANGGSRGCNGRRLNYSNEYYWHDKDLSCAPGNPQR